MNQTHNTVSAGIRITFITILALTILFSFVFIGNATDSGPMLSVFTPSAGSNISQSQTTVSFKAYDPDGLDDSGIQLKFNGVTVPVTVKHVELGYWETVLASSCTPNTYQRWISQGFDESQATISASITPSDVNMVEVTTSDKLGNTSSAQWSFNCMLAPVISNILPANNSFQNSLTTISAKLTDNGEIDQTSIILKLDSVLCPTSFDPTTGNLSYLPPQVLAEGKHTLYLEVKDASGNKQTSTTTFTISTDSTGPIFQELVPANGTSLTSTATGISLIATDQQQIDESSIQVKVNDVTIPHSVSYPEIGHLETQTVYLSCTNEPFTSEIWVHEGWDYTKATIKASVAAIDHNTVLVSAKDKLGNPAQTSWSFDCMQNPVISNQTPANGTVQTFVPKVSAIVKDNGVIDPSTIILKMNSTVVPHSFSATTGIISYVPQLPLPVGDYTFDLEVKDVAGNTQTTAWSFTVVTDGNGPVISGVTPAEGGTITTTTTKYSLTAIDYDGINNSSVRIVANGIEIPAQNISVTNAQLGHYVSQIVYDSCTGEAYTTQVWVVDGPDLTKVTVSTNLTNLPDVNFVSLTISDKLGKSTVMTTSFKTSVPPGFSALKPADGSLTLDLQPTISAQISDNSSIDPGSILLKVNNVVVGHTFTPSGGSAGIVSYVPTAPLPNGVATIYLEAKDALGNLGSVSWRLSVGPGVASFSEAKPLPDSTVSIANSDISVAVVDQVNITSVSMAINNKPVIATIKYQQKGHYELVYDSCSLTYYEVWVLDNAYYYDRGTITYKPTNLSDGTNLVTVLVTNQFGGVTAYTWSFEGRIPPQISELFPANGSSITDRKPVISAKLIENSKVASYKMLFDAVEVGAILDANTGKLSYQVPAQLPNSSDHNVSVTVYDELGLSAVASTQFHIEIFPDMTGTISSECLSCHSGYPEPNHPMGNCDACHGNGLGGHGDLGCGDCHGGHSAAYVTNCVSCHGTAPHVTTSHNSTTNLSTCNNCHSASLSREHNRYKDSNGNAFTCDTCHASTDLAVKNAITTRKTNCDACHSVVGHDQVHPSPINSSCRTCHSEFLSKEHLTNLTTAGKNYNCDICHSSTVSKEVYRSVATGELNCAGCHSKAHEVSVVDNVPEDIPLYTGFHWTSPVNSKILAGQPTAPPDFGEGKVVLSDSRNDVTLPEIAAFYKAQLPARGWTLLDTPSFDPACIASFSSGDRQVHIICYKPSQLEGAGTDVGYKLEIWYK